MNSDDITPQITIIADHYVYHSPPDLLVQSLNLISKWLQRLRDILSSIHLPILQSTDSTVVAYGIQVLLYALVCASIVAAAYLIVKLVIKRTHRLPHQSASVQIELPSSQYWQDQARTLALQEDWKNACRALYLASLQIMSEKEIVAFIPTRTNQEYIHLLHAHIRLQILFVKLIAIVESSWFGNHIAVESDYKQCSQILNNIFHTINANVAEAD